MEPSQGHDRRGAENPRRTPSAGHSRRIASLHVIRSSAAWRARRNAWQYADTFWTWRETMYRFALDTAPQPRKTYESRRNVALRQEMLNKGYARVGEFHYLHHDHDGRPYANPAEMATRIAQAAEITGIGLTLLPSFYAHSFVRWSRTTCRPAPVHLLDRPVCRADCRHTEGRPRVARGQCRCRSAQPAGRDAR